MSMGMPTCATCGSRVVELAPLTLYKCSSCGAYTWPLPADNAPALLAEQLAAAAEPEPLLIELADLLDHDDPALRQVMESALLRALDLRKPEQAVVDDLLRRVAARHPQRSAVTRFVEVARQAHHQVLNNAWRKVIRSISGSYESDGTVPRCPKCRSTQVSRGMELYEFTEMICGACGHRQLTDDYQLERWYPE